MKSDTEWIRETLDGDPSAFGELVRKYQDRLFRTLLPIVGGTDDSLDLVQEVFVRAYTRLSQFRLESSFFTWLYRIAVRLASDFHRSPGRRERSYETNDLPADPGFNSHVEEPFVAMLRDEQCAAVRQAIDRLPHEQRIVIVMREMDGHCYETIAEILDLPVGTVRSRLHRARLRLCDELRCVFHHDDEE